MPQVAIEKVSNLKVEVHAGLSYQGYLQNDGLRNLFTVTSLSQDRNGEVYVSTMESTSVSFRVCTNPDVLTILHSGIRLLFDVAVIFPVYFTPIR